VSADSNPTFTPGGSSAEKFLRSHPRLSPAVEESLDSTHLKQLFHIYATEQEAVQSFW
jgi:hypothetical protein